MLPFDYCCSSARKELKKRTCKVCNQYIPSAYRMKNHYKIHAQNYDDFDHDQEDRLPPPTSDTNDANENQTATTTTKPVIKTEILDWLRSDFDGFDVDTPPKQLESDRVTRSKKKLPVEEETSEAEGDKNKDWLHVE
jgi:hypothetical protein